MIGLILAGTAQGQQGGAPQGTWLGFRNDLNVPIVIQSGVMVRNVMRPQGKPRVLYPGEVSLDPIIPPGNRVIIIANAKRPNQVLLQDNLTINKDQFFSVQLDPPAKAKLVPARMPTLPRRTGKSP
jgi:hypothetical protein